MNSHPFDLLVELPDADVRLDCAALHLARDVYPHIGVQAYLTRLDALAAEVAGLRAGLAAPLRYQALREVLVAQHGLNGNKDDYYDPDNSYLSRVLDRGCGIPISLAVVWIEVGRRLKWPVAGAGLPGHFLVRIDDPERFVAVDVFNDARTLSLDDCEKLLEQQFEGKVKFQPELLDPVDTRSILSRMLANLRQIYMVNHNWPRLRDVLHRLTALEPQNSLHLQELAALHFRLGDVRGAYAHLAACLQRLPDGTDDRQGVQNKLERLEAAIAALN
jgi:regulator of sirC expression with transglutaminase-like and TPR domain